MTGFDSPQEDAPGFSAVYDTAIRLLARREHSVAELRRKLLLRCSDKLIVEKVLEQLQEERLLSDERFAEMYVHFRRDKGIGPLRLRVELRERGVADVFIDTYVLPQESEWSELLSGVREKRFGADFPKDYKEQVRQARFLQHRGFAAEQIRKLLKQDI